MCQYNIQHIPKQASNERLFNLQNSWILFNHHGKLTDSDSLEVALETFKTHMSDAYVMPDSRVYLLIETDHNFWEVWDGFRLNVSEEIQVSQVGIMTPDRVEIKLSDRTNFHRIGIRASTVVSHMCWVRLKNLDLKS